ncbi:hypothetical protein [Streptomyces rimosus]|uniref:hypothetical protein n=1 Tax=Streptomyces rimosus TaxID=1927 RepID=UPI00068E2540|nr:hypothetical protein [Streptomyces rimosus]
MIWFISKRRHAARVQVVQGRLARVKSDRDRATSATAAAVVIVGRLAGRVDRLEHDLDTSRALARRHGDALDRADTDLDRAEAEVRELRRIRTLLEDALDYYTAAVAQPVHVLVRDGRPHGVHRSKEAAGQAVRQADPGVPDLTTWKPRRDADSAVGWSHWKCALAEVPAPPQAAAIEEYYRALEVRTPAALSPELAEVHGSHNPDVLAAHLADGCPDCVDALGEVNNLVLVHAHQAARGTGSHAAADRLQREMTRRVRVEQGTAALTELTQALPTA